MRLSILAFALPLAACSAGCGESPAVDQIPPDSQGLDSGLDSPLDDAPDEQPPAPDTGPDSPDPSDADADTGPSAWLRYLPLFGSEYWMPLVTMAPSGDLLVVAPFSDTIDLDGHALDAGQSGSEFALVRLDPTGAVVWAKSTSSEKARALRAAFNAGGEVFAAADLGESGSFGGPGAMGDSYVAKLGADGSQLWIANWGSNYDYADSVAQVVVPDDLGGCAAAGTYDEDGPSSSPEQPLPFAVGYRPDGTSAWMTSFEINERASVHSGSPGTGGSYVFGGSVASGVQTSAGWVVSLDSAGALSWRTDLSGPALAIAFDGQGFLYVGGSVQHDEYSSETSAYLAKLDASGTIVWSHEWLSTLSFGSAQLSGVGVLSPNRIAVGGVFSASSLVGGGVTIPGDISGTTSFIAVLDDEFHCSGWHLMKGSDPAEMTNGYPGLVSFSANGTGRAVAVGHAYTKMVFDEPAQTSGDGDVFLLSLEP